MGNGQSSEGIDPPPIFVAPNTSVMGARTRKRRTTSTPGQIVKRSRYAAPIKNVTGLSLNPARPNPSFKVAPVVDQWSAYSPETAARIQREKEAAALAQSYGIPIAESVEYAHEAEAREEQEAEHKKDLESRYEGRKADAIAKVSDAKLVIDTARAAAIRAYNDSVNEDATIAALQTEKKRMETQRLAIAGELAAAAATLDDPRSTFVQINAARLIQGARTVEDAKLQARLAVNATETRTAETARDRLREENRRATATRMATSGHVSMLKSAFNIP